MVVKQRSLGRTGITLSEIGLGTVKFGRNTDVKYPEYFRLPSDEEILDLLREAATLGINCLDTAPAYGDSEHRLGELLPEIEHHFQVITKVGEFYDAVKGSHYDFSEGTIIESVYKSLATLSREYLDIVLLHSDGNDCVHLEKGALKTLIGLREQGLIRAIGLSGKTREGGQVALDQGADCLMITFNPNQQNEAPLVNIAERYGAGILVKKALGSGQITRDIDIVFRDLFAHKNITSAIIGTKNPLHLRQNCQKLP